MELLSGRLPLRLRTIAGRRSVASRCSSVRCELARASVSFFCVALVVENAAGRRPAVLVWANFPVFGQALQPAACGGGFGEIAMSLQEFTQSLCRILILPLGGERLRNEKLDLRRLAVRLGESLLRCFQRLVILLVMVVGLG